MQKKIIRTTALILCFCILLLAVPNTFARNGKRTIKHESRFHFNFVKPVELLSGLFWSILPPLSDGTDTVDKNNTTNSKIKITGGASKSHVSDGD